MTFEQAFVEKKLSNLNGYLEELDDFFCDSDKEILSDSGKVHIAERLLQLIVDTMVDINQHFIKELHFPLSEDFQSTFIILGEHEILPKDFSARLAPIVGLRNRVVHRYENLDKELFLSLLRKNKDDFRVYVGLILAVLARKK